MWGCSLSGSRNYATIMPYLMFTDCVTLILVDDSHSNCSFTQTIKCSIYSYFLVVLNSLPLQRKCAQKGRKTLFYFTVYASTDSEPGGANITVAIPFFCIMAILDAHPSWLLVLESCSYRFVMTLKAIAYPMRARPAQERLLCRSFSNCQATSKLNPMNNYYQLLLCV